MLRRIRVHPLLLAVALGVISTGCSLPYLADTAAHHLALLAHRRPIAEVIADPATPVVLRQQLQQVEQVRAFARTLGLRVDDNYAAYVDVGREYVTHNLSACPPDRFAPYEWRFPFVGAVPYKGYFRLTWAKREERRLREAGYETYLRGVLAYSTLGWLADPLFSTMVGGDPYGLADTLFHELTHATLFIKGQVPFDETLATFVAERATLAFAATQNGPGSPVVARLERGYAEGGRFETLVYQLYGELDTLYRDAPPDVAARREAIYSRFRVRLHDPASQITSPGYQRFADLPLNNARLLAYHRYHAGTAELAALFAREGGSIEGLLTLLTAHEKELKEAPVEWIRTRLSERRSAMAHRP